MNRLQFFNVTIINDLIFERDIENFTLELRFNPFEHQRPSNVVLVPSVSVVNILDVGKIIHLEPTTTATLNGKNNRVRSIIIIIVKINFLAYR